MAQAIEELEQEQEERPSTQEATSREEERTRPAFRVETTRPKPHRVKVRVSHKRRTVDEQNELIRDNLAQQYGIEDALSILNAAQQSYHYRNASAETNAESYELLEDGHIDAAIESFNLKPWVIGRPKNLG